jgi:hypothetical protein
VVGFALVLLLRRRSPGKGGGVKRSQPDPDDPYGTFTTEQLAADANALLVAADDALKTSEQELTFAVAQYGAAATVEFSAALEQSRADVAAAFHRRQPAASNSTAGSVDLAVAVAAAQQVATAVRSEMAQSLPDPFDALRRLELVDSRLDAALDSIRDAALRADRARAMLDQAIPAARAEISAVTNFAGRSAATPGRA